MLRGGLTYPVLFFVLTDLFSNTDMLDLENDLPDELMSSGSWGSAESAKQPTGPGPGQGLQNGDPGGGGLPSQQDGSGAVPPGMNQRHPQLAHLMSKTPPHLPNSMAGQGVVGQPSGLTMGNNKSPHAMQSPPNKPGEQPHMAGMMATSTNMPVNSVAMSMASNNMMSMNMANSGGQNNVGMGQNSMNSLGMSINAMNKPQQQQAMLGGMGPMGNSGIHQGAPGMANGPVMAARAGTVNQLRAQQPGGHLQQQQSHLGPRMQAPGGMGPMMGGNYSYPNQGPNPQLGPPRAPPNMTMGQRFVNPTNPQQQQQAVQQQQAQAVQQQQQQQQQNAQAQQVQAQQQNQPGDGPQQVQPPAQSPAQQAQQQAVQNAAQQAQQQGAAAQLNKAAGMGGPQQVAPQTGTAAGPGQPGQPQQAPAPAADPEKRKLIQQQLVLLLHAHKCQRRESQNNGESWQVGH
jgi:E1A/CREB-binding protein